MQKIRLMFAAAAMVASAGASAQSMCDQFGNAIEAGLKELSYYSVAGIMDNSAARETNRKLDQNLQIQMIQANLTLMQANKCPLPKAPVIETAYQTAALGCAAARAASGSSKQIPECDRAKWTRDTIAPLRKDQL